MRTIIIRADENNINTEDMAGAGRIIKAGGLVAFPTETVYGLGGDALNPGASRKIYAAKGRPSDNPLIVHISRIESLYDIADDVNGDALKLADKFWPGPLTMIFKKKEIVPYETTGGLDTVAVRMPSNAVAAAFIEAAGGFIAAPSANLSGRPSPTSASHVIEDMEGRIDMIIDGGSSVIGLESTIVDMTDEVPMILRPGYITGRMIEDTIGRVAYDPAVFCEGPSDTPPRAPGMRYRHYAPKGDLTIVKGEKEAVVKYIREALADGHKRGLKVAILAAGAKGDEYPEADFLPDIGSREDEDSIARSLYGVLRQCDEEEIDLIYSEDFSTPRMGTAIMNRLIKAAGHKLVEV
ncbi:MAG: threonylcarbamoyl-AMP synthase [Lachnospiraceae bacterium]|nr:threonylcarbamoyl-AMP synthase [Lachnospiraceae bacterium]